MSFHPPAEAFLSAFMGVGDDGLSVGLWDVTRLIPRREPWPVRELEAVRRQYVHHSGALRVGDPFSHLCSSAQFSIRSRGWRGTGYHTWIPFSDVFDDDGSRVVYLCNRPERRTWHAGEGPNGAGLAHCLQGNTTRRPMSEAQRMALPVVLRYFAKLLGLTPAALGHFQAVDGNPKATCPGSHAEAWLHGYHAGRDSRKNDSPWA